MLHKFEQQLSNTQHHCFSNAEQDLVIVRVSQLLDPTENGTIRLTNGNMASGEMVQEKDKIKRLN